MTTMTALLTISMRTQKITTTTESTMLKTATMMATESMMNWKRKMAIQTPISMIMTMME